MKTTIKDNISAIPVCGKACFAPRNSKYKHPVCEKSDFAHRSRAREGKRDAAGNHQRHSSQPPGTQPATTRDAAGNSQGHSKQPPGTQPG